MTDLGLNVFISLSLSVLICKMEAQTYKRMRLDWTLLGTLLGQLMMF